MSISKLAYECPALGEVVHTQHRDLADLRIGQSSDHADRRVPRHRDAEPVGQPGCGPPGQRERQQLQHAAQHRGTAGTPLRQGSHQLGERPHLAARIAAHQTAYRDGDQYLPSARRQALEQSAVVPVQPNRHRAAART
jgi:hypothetical protein